jgi:hypothetical protein
MSAWERTLDDLRREAHNETLEDPMVTDEVKELATGAIDEAAMVKIREMAKTMKGLPLPPTRIVRGWQVSLSRFRKPDPGGYRWHFSAMLTPRGRSSTKIDWENLGRIAARLGAPRDPMIVPENPNDAHHWSWPEVEPS